MNINLRDGKTIYHFDCYRINNQEEILDLGFENYLETGDYIFIEWPEHISNYLPEDAQKITISQENAEKRSFELEHGC